MHALVAGRDDAPARVRGAALPGGDDPAGAGDDRHERKHVVGLELRLDHQIVVAGGGQQIGVASAAVAQKPHRLFASAEGLTVVRIHQQWAGREQDRLGEIGAGAHPQIAFSSRAAVARPSAVAAEALAGEGLVHHAEHRFARAQQGDQRAPGRHAGDEGFRPVDGIEHPDIFRVGALLAVFLADDAMIRKRSADERAHRRFGRVIGGGDGIEAAGAALVLDAERGAEERQGGLGRHGGELLHGRWKVDPRHVAGPSPALPFDLPKTGMSGNRPRRLVGPAAPCEVALPARARPVKGRVHEHSKRHAHRHFRRRHHARRHARLDLHRQPVPAQFGWRHRAQPGGGSRPFTGRDRSLVEHLLFGVRRRPDSARHGARPIRPADLSGGRRRDHGRRRRRVRVRRKPRGSDRRPGAAGLGTGGLVCGLARRLPPAVSTRSLCHARRPAGWDRDAGSAPGHGSARLFDRDDRVRGSFLGVAAVTFLIGLLIALVVKDDAGCARSRETLRESLSGILAVLRTPSVGRLFVMNLVAYSTFGLIVGLWGGPYLTHIYGYDLEQRGSFLLIPALTQIVGSMLWGPLDRLTGSHKRPVLVGAGATAAALCYLALVGTLTPFALVAWFAAFGFLSAYVPVLVAHGKALFSPHQVGRGLTVLNMGTMGGT